MRDHLVVSKIPLSSNLYHGLVEPLCDYDRKTKKKKFPIGDTVRCFMVHQRRCQNTLGPRFDHEIWAAAKCM